jgi:hypothetical protein
MPSLLCSWAKAQPQKRLRYERNTDGLPETLSQPALHSTWPLKKKDIPKRKSQNQQQQQQQQK